MRRSGALIVSITLLLAACVGAQDTACRLMPSDFAQVQWASIRAACSPAPPTQFCPACICGIGGGLVTGLYMAGVDLEPNQATLDSLLSTCTATVGGALVEGGNFTPEALASLAQCDVAEVAKACAASLADEQGNRSTMVANTTVSAASGAKPMASAAAGLRNMGAAGVATAAAAGLLLLMLLA